MLTVACVNHGNYLSRGRQYVDILARMVTRNLDQPYKFVCLEDEGIYAGWWAKIELFRPGRFTGRILYLDLDCVVTGSLDKLVTHKGIINLLDWGWTASTLGSGVMVWDAGEHTEIFTKFEPSVISSYEGDQNWITYLSGWDYLPAKLCRSYRYHCIKSVPEECVHVSMHGSPKPHEILTGWVPRLWN